MAAPLAKLGQYCDVGQVPQAGCGFCNLVYQYTGGPPTNCLEDVSPLPALALSPVRCVSCISASLEAKSWEFLYICHYVTAILIRSTWSTAHCFNHSLG